MASRPALAMLLAGLLGCLLALPPGRAAADAHRYSDDDDHVAAREAVRRGEALPLAEILAAIPPHVAGRVIEVELEREDGLLVYEITLVAADGRVRELVVDAATARVLEMEVDED
ncbi:PepSY domain-containing protein [Salinarimonas rosea]|uniref:PepSY domain-containing protein n=1 Tax=Salinarimonas rosea TaxID=552063 RepID=UPI000490E223|nr:PepSY domain-containing protein [Salinarimonas rosea]